MLIFGGMMNVIPRSSRDLISNPLAFKSENVKFFPFFAKNHDVTFYKKYENWSKNKFSFK